MKPTNTLSEEDQLSVQETLYLLSIPNMLQSIQEGIKIPLSECVDHLD